MCLDVDWFFFKLDSEISNSLLSVVQDSIGITVTTSGEQAPARSWGFLRRPNTGKQNTSTGLKNGTDFVSLGKIVSE